MRERGKFVAVDAMEEADIESAKGAAGRMDVTLGNGGASGGPGLASGQSGGTPAPPPAPPPAPTLVDARLDATPGAPNGHPNAKAHGYTKRELKTLGPKLRHNSYAVNVVFEFDQPVNPSDVGDYGSGKKYVLRQTGRYALNVNGARRKRDVLADVTPANIHIDGNRLVYFDAPGPDILSFPSGVRSAPAAAHITGEMSYGTGLYENGRLIGQVEWHLVYSGGPVPSASETGSVP